MSYYNIAISLGNVCYTAKCGVKNKVRSTKSQGYATCPFDLMASNYNLIQFKNEENPNDDFAKLRDVLKIKYHQLNYTIHLIP